MKKVIYITAFLALISFSSQAQLGKLKNLVKKDTTKTTETKEEKMVRDYTIYNIVIFLSLSFFLCLTILYHFFFLMIFFFFTDNWKC